MTSAATLLVVDDENEIRRFLDAILLNHGFVVKHAENGRLALKMIERKPPDLVLLDLGLPDMDGQAVLQHIRSWSKIPVIVLSARDQETQKIMALDNGADDYVTKPFATGELLARIKVALRHANTIENKEGAHVYNYDGLHVDLVRRIVTLDGQELKLTPTEYKLLMALVMQAGKVVTQSTLINAVWGKNSQGNSHYLRIYVQHLRNKLQDDPLKPRFILTEPGIGYRLIGF